MRSEGHQAPSLLTQLRGVAFEPPPKRGCLLAQRVVLLLLCFRGVIADEYLLFLGNSQLNASHVSQNRSFRASERMCLGIEHVFIQTDQVWRRKDEVKVLEGFREPEAL